MNLDGKLREIKKVLMSGNTIRIGPHTKDQLMKRGYTRRDILWCIFNGRITEVQKGMNYHVERICPTYVIAGRDYFENPIAVVISDEGNNTFSLVTTMPPTDKRRFKETIS
ncbi:DUF4258 domain-containing protein [Sutcliffiella horikoshii]|uniref:DUF4258 domain-containing protein n=1 Tax=Sutcliffiella horikoshii TaxID=79883 RepID=UPI002041C9E9|nr:DUF4258 domain-containing protein [Sutcliffiella horikoshii]MCM3619707.1 DUF4258 domain-containing protein [Sutcliffiella horikoshii]